MATSETSPGDVLEGELTAALARIGEDDDLREEFLLACLAAEERIAFSIGESEVGSVRDIVTAPIVDALHANRGVLRKGLSTGEIFEFPYRSKIAREFVLSVPRIPDHVWEPQTTKALVAFARDASEVIIGGAYFGDQAILVAKAVAQGEGRVHAFEPNPEEAATLRRNAELNDARRLVVREVGLWGIEDVRLQLVGEDSHAFPEVVAADDSDQAGTFPATTIDRYVRDEGVSHVNLIMLDIEGGELQALMGAAGELRRPAPEAPIIVFEIHGGYVDWSDGLLATPVVDLLVRAGYTLFAIRDYQGNVDMTGEVIELVPVDDVYLNGPPHGFNLLAVKDVGALDRLGEWRLCPGVSPKLLAHKDPSLHAPLRPLK